MRFVDIDKVKKNLDENKPDWTAEDYAVACEDAEFYSSMEDFIAEHDDEIEMMMFAPELVPDEPTWIPCSERLPDQGERVIVAIFGSDMIMPNEGETLQDAIERSRKEGYITVGFIGSDGWYGADWFPLMVHPSYWMPKPDLPEPPKE